MAATPQPDLPPDDGVRFDRVADVNPSRLLMQAGANAGRYVPRDVDRVLGGHLAKPGTLVVAHEHASGARRTVYEALVRTLPRALLAMPDNSPAAALPADGDVVVWLDSGRVPYPTEDLLRAHIDQGERRGRTWVVIIVNQDNRLLPGLEQAVAPGSFVRIPNRLSEPEKARAAGVFPGIEIPESVEDLYLAIAARGEDSQGWLAGYAADTDGGADLLGIGTDVNMLADLVASRLVEPPLSIGLFGDWGSGKSFFMRQLRERVSTLAALAASAEDAAGVSGPGVSSYCASVRQITFNAWHYTEANLWASLATQIFDSLAATGTEDELNRRVEDLAAQREREQSLLGRLSTARMQRVLLTAQQDQTRPSVRERAAAVLRQLSADDRKWAVEQTGVTEPDIQDLERAAADLAGAGAEGLRTWRSVRHDPVLWLIVVLGALVTVALGLTLGHAAWWSSALAAAVTVMSTAGRWARRVREVAARLRAAIDSSGTGAAALAELDTEIAELERAVRDLAPARGLATFAESRGGSDDYRRHLGVVSLLRKDLETFAAMLRRERARTGDRGIERIVLYVDDLDRCPTPVVIQVLEAIHLLLALPVFTVVVGVDERWLTRAIRRHYAEMFGPDNPELPAADYLEKIFQVPFTLPAMTGAAFARLVEGLSTADHEAPPDATAPARVETVLSDEPTPLFTELLDLPPEPVPTPLPAAVRPRRLALTAPELAFLAQLGPLIPSPRAAKRLINLYRLIRARLTGDELTAFITPGPEAPHRAVLVLLAILVGRRPAVDKLLEALLIIRSDTLGSLLQTLEPAGEPVRTLRNWPNDANALPDLIATYRPWVGLVRRFGVRGG